jgi:hypothetical protein
MKPESVEATQHLSQVLNLGFDLADVFSNYYFCDIAN